MALGVGGLVKIGRLGALDAACTFPTSFLSIQAQGGHRGLASKGEGNATPTNNRSNGKELTEIVVRRLSVTAG